MVYYVIATMLALFLGQVAGHLNKKLPPVVAEEITYKEFFSTLVKNFKIDYLFSLTYILLFNLLIYFIGFNITTVIYFVTISYLFPSFTV